MRPDTAIATGPGTMRPVAAPDPLVPEAWRGIRRVLVVRLDNLGDVLMTGPVLRTLRESIPGAHLTLMASPAGEDVLAQLRVMARRGGCAVMPSEACHQELETTVPDRTVDAPWALSDELPRAAGAPR